MIRADDDRLREMLLGQEQALHEVFSILREEDSKDDVLRAIIRSSKGERTNRIMHPDPDRIFSRAAIHRMCIVHRSRFLDAGRYRGSIPAQALYEVRQLELRSPVPLMGFKILAPDSCFHARTKRSDPMLFVPLGEGHYYLVHRSGNLFHPMRTVLMWPLRGPFQLITALALLASLLSVCVPNPLLGVGPETPWWGTHRLLGGFWITLVIAAFSSFAWFTFFGRFSRDAWNILGAGD